MLDDEGVIRAKGRLENITLCEDKKHPISLPAEHPVVHLLTLHFFMHFCPGTMTTQAESINSDLPHGLDRRLRHTQHWTQNRTI